jgi:hypothetical protein
MPPVEKPKFEDKEFHMKLPDTATGGVTIAMIGSTRSGKTTLLKEALMKVFDEHLGVLMSPSLHAPVYKDMAKNMVKSPEYIPRVIDEMYSINRKTNNHYPFLVVLDDVVTAKFDRTLMKSFTIYRNSGITTVMSVQNPIILNSVTRGNINFILLGYLNSDEACEKAVRMFCYASIEGKNIEEKIHEYKRLTADHHWLFINHLDGEMFRFKLKL